MTKWKNRSEEEKKRIYEEQNALREKKGKRQLFDLSKCKELLDSGELPVLCSVHGWVKSDTYSQVNESPGLGLPSVLMIKGTCPDCGRETKKAITSIDELTIYSILIMKVAKEGRMLGDKRQ